MNKIIKFSLSIISCAFITLFHGSGISSAQNDFQLYYLNGNDHEKTSISLSRPDKFIKEPVVKLLAKLLYEKNEKSLEMEPLNAEKDVTFEGEDRGLYLNQTMYLRNAGIDPEKVKLEYDTDLKKTIVNSRNRYFTSLIDIDNDGVNEIRFHSVQGTLYVEDNYFFKKQKNGKYLIVKNDLCAPDGGGESLSFVRCENKVYTLKKEGEPVRKIEIYCCENGEFKSLYTMEINYDKLRTSADKASKIIDAVIKDAGEIISDLSFDVPICGDAESIETYRYLSPDLKGTAFMADIDNDEKNEIILKEKGGRANWLSYSCYSKKDGKWFNYDMNAAYKNFTLFDSDNSDFTGDEDFIIKKYCGKNYILKIKIGEKFEINNGHTIDIFMIDKDNVKKEGTVNAAFDRTITVKKTQAGKTAK
ncbi:MAG TPA: hypothetical protein PKK26_07580 [Candidatus Wallbacteria bacterium]|nr:hypothetical protein [Candidatus Wallbacteria bacterium]